MFAVVSEPRMDSLTGLEGVEKKGGDKHLRNLAREEDSFTIQIINKALEVVQPEPNPVFLTQPS